MAIFEAPKAKNKDIEEYADMPKDKVERHDGLPTKEDMQNMIGGKKEKSPCGMGDHSEKPTIELIIKILS